MNPIDKISKVLLDNSRRVELMKVRDDIQQDAEDLFVAGDAAMKNFLAIDRVCRFGSDQDVEAALDAVEEARSGQTVRPWMAS